MYEEDGLKKVVALLDSMWGDRAGLAPIAFRINPHNLSGRRLYTLCGADVTLRVTNSCRELQTHANGHGTPDPAYVAENLKRLEPFDLLLVCGAVAKKTYKAAGCTYQNAMLIDHPAARRWSKASIQAVAAAVKKALS